MTKNNRAAVVPSSALPTADEAVDAYERAGGRLTHFPNFGHDPLDGYDNLQNARYSGFVSKYPNFESIFSYVANGNDTLFRSGLLYFISLTFRLSLSI